MILILRKICLLAFGVLIYSGVLCQPLANFTFELPDTQSKYCAPVSVQFTNTSSGSSPSYSWSVNGNPFSAEENPVRTFPQGGVFQVCLLVTDNTGADTLCQTLEFFDPPTLSLTVAENAGCTPFDASFTLNTSTTLDSIIWDFGDGAVLNMQASGNQATMQHSYDLAGSFTLTVTAFDVNGCEATVIKPNFINVTPAPDANFSASPTLGCSVPHLVNFSPVSPNPSFTYTWTFGDGATSNTISPAHTYQNFGTYDVTLQVYNPVSNCTATNTITDLVVIGNLALFNFTEINDGDCSTTLVQFDAVSSGNVASYLWDFGDGNTSAQASPLHSYNQAGCFFPSLTVTTSDGCVSTHTSSECIKANGPVQLAYTTTGNLTSCDAEANLAVSFFGQSAQAIAWEWNFGGLGTSNQQNPVFTFSGYGTYPVTLTATFPDGCTSSVTTATVSIQPLFPFFTADQTRGCAELEVHFTSLINTTETITSYQWNFGGGFSTTGPNPTFTFTDAGTYDVVLVVESASGCVDSLRIEDYIQVGTVPDLNFDADPRVSCIEENVQFTNTSTSELDAWEWYFGDGGYANQENPMHEYNDTGYFDIKFIGWNNGCSDTLIFEDFVHILAPKAIFTIDQSCGSSTIGFMDTSIGADTWLWDFGDGNTSTEQSPVHTFAGSGSYQVLLTVTNAITGCEDDQQILVVIAHPEPSFTFSSTLVCVGDTIQVTNTSTGMNYFTWNYPPAIGVVIDAFPDPEPAFYFPTAGTYYGFLLTAFDNNGCRFEFTYPDTVVVAGVDVDFTSSLQFGCAPLPVTFTADATTSIGTIQSYLWDFGDGETATEANPTHTFQTNQNYTISLTVTNSMGCSTTEIKQNFIQVFTPVAGFSAQLIDCETNVVQFNNSSSGNGLNWHWDFGDGNVSTQINPQHTFSVNGNYVVCLEGMTADGCSDTFCDTLAIGPPQANFVGDNLYKSCPNPPLITHFTDQSGNAVAWQWDFGDGGVSILSNPTHSYSASGLYSVCLIVTSQLGCRDTFCRIDYIQVDGPSGSFTGTPTEGCTDLEVQFFASGLNVAKYTWDFGDGNGLINNTATNVDTATHIYTTGGQFQPVLIVEDLGGCKVPVVGPIINVETIEADFTANLRQLCAGNSTVNFSATVENSAAVQSLEWTFHGADNPSATGWNPSGITFPGPGTYSVDLTIITANCQRTITKTDFITVSPLPVFTMPADTIICPGESVSLNVGSANPGWMLTWADNRPGLSCYQGCSDPIATPVMTTSYIFTATNAAGCTATDSVRVSLYDTKLDVLGENRTICRGDSIQLQVLNGDNPVWNGGANLSCNNCPDPFVFPDQTSVFSVTVGTNGNCLISDDITVSVLEPDSLYAGPGGQICAGDIFTPMAHMPAGEISWMINGTKASALPDPGFVLYENAHIVLLLTNDGCMLSDSLDVRVIPKAELFGEDQQICIGEETQLEVWGTATELNWEPAVGLSSDTVFQPLAAPLQTTVYQVTGSIEGCEADTVVVELVVNDLPEVSINGFPKFREGAWVPMEAVVTGAGPFNYLWQTLSPINCLDCQSTEVRPDSNSVVQLIVRDVNGCVDSSAIQMKLLEICDGEQFFVPNAFTPNGDGENDFFYVRGEAEMTIFRIYNRWGELVFETSDQSQGWDGTFKGEKLNRDVFVYYVEGICKYDGKTPVLKSGDVTLIR